MVQSFQFNKITENIYQILNKLSPRNILLTNNPYVPKYYIIMNI